MDRKESDFAIRVLSPVLHDSIQERIISLEDFVGEADQALVGREPGAQTEEVREQIVGGSIWVGLGEDGEGAGGGAGDAHAAVDEEVGVVPAIRNRQASEGQNRGHVGGCWGGESLHRGADALEFEGKNRRLGKSQAKEPEVVVDFSSFRFAGRGVPEGNDVRDGARGIGIVQGGPQLVNTADGEAMTHGDYRVARA